MYDLTKNKLIKDTVVLTPDDLSNFIFKKISKKPYINILDIGCFNGSFSKPFKNKKNSFITGVDILNDFEENFDKFIKKDFLTTTNQDFNNVDLVVCNPPFNDLMAWKFIKHSFSVFGKNQPMIFIVPEYILNNSKNRAIELEQYNITKIIKLNQYTFKNVAIHCSVVFFNIHFKSKKLFEYYYPVKKTKGKIRTIYFTKEQENILTNELKIKNFTKYIKGLISKDCSNFPS